VWTFSRESVWSIYETIVTASSQPPAITQAWRGMRPGSVMHKPYTIPQEVSFLATHRCPEDCSNLFPPFCNHSIGVIAGSLIRLETFCLKRQRCARRNVRSYSEPECNPRQSWCDDSITTVVKFGLGSGRSVVLSAAAQWYLCVNKTKNFIIASLDDVYWKSFSR
jgi:hypothetical protein